MDSEGLVNDRKGDWMQTYTGKQFWPGDPRVGDFDILDIAHGLSNVCRFSGQCNQFYSVAEHAYWVSLECDPADALEGLLHDTTEAYLSDLVTAVKKLVPEYKVLEKNMEEVVAKQFGLWYPWPVSVQKADLTVLMAEARDNLERPPRAWAIDVPPMEQKIACWTPAEAKGHFLSRYEELRAVRAGTA